MTSSFQNAGALACLGLPAGQSFRLTVSGGSMVPALREGDELLVERLPSAEGLRIGDIVVIDAPGGLVVHRLLLARNGMLRTRGDGTRRMDAPLPVDRLVGRVVRATRAGRSVLPPAWRLRLTGLAHFVAAATHRLGRTLQETA